MDYVITTPDSILREGYSILEIELESTLENVNELYFGRTPSDILTVLLKKIKLVKLGYPQEFDYDVMQELIALENTIYVKIIAAFEKEFFNGELYFAEHFQDISSHTIADFIYKYFYLQRREIVDNYLSNTLFANRTNLAKRYKTSAAKKDITYQAIRSELKVSSPDLYIVVMHACNICEDLLLDDNLDIVTLFGHSELDETEEELLHRLFEFNGVDICQILTNNLRSSTSFDYYKSLFKNHVFNMAQKIN